MIVAAGASERPIVFGGNDRPGVMLGSAVRSYLNRFAVAPGRRFAIFTDNNDGWRTATDLIAAGQEVCAVIDARPENALPADRSGVGQVLAGAQVIATRGWHGLQKVVVATGSGERTIAADALAVCGGWNPTLALTCHRGGKPAWNDDIAAFVPGPAVAKDMKTVGAARGTLSLAGALAEGAHAGAEAASLRGGNAVTIPIPRAADDKFQIAPLWYVKNSRGKAFVDLQNDVTVKDIAIARQEGFRAVEHLKRYTTLGMATDQGKTTNVIGLAIMAGAQRAFYPRDRHHGFSPSFYTGQHRRLGRQRHGKHFRPIRRPPSHRFAQEQGAAFVEAGLWLRAQWFPRAGEKDWLESVDCVGAQECCSIISVSAMSRRSARSTSKGPTPALCSIVSTSTPSRRLPWVRPAMASCCGKTGS